MRFCSLQDSGERSHGPHLLGSQHAKCHQVMSTYNQGKGGDLQCWEDVFQYSIQTTLKGIGLEAILLIKCSLPKKHLHDMSTLSRWGRPMSKSKTMSLRHDTFLSPLLAKFCSGILEEMLKLKLMLTLEQMSTLVTFDRSTCACTHQERLCLPYC